MSVGIYPVSWIMLKSFVISLIRNSPIVVSISDHRLRRGPDTSLGQKRQNPCPSSLRASDMFEGYNN